MPRYLAATSGLTYGSNVPVANDEVDIETCSSINVWLAVALSPRRRTLQSAARNVNRSLVWGFDCVPSFSSGEFLCRRARVQSQVERSEPEGNLDGFLARLHHSQQNEGKAALPLGEVGFINGR
jgi:hypothetical protein